MRGASTLFALAAGILVFPSGASAQEGISFERQVLPILRKRCFECHANQFEGRRRRVKGGLRLDGKQWILKGGKSGRVVVPGNASRSPLYTRVSLPEDHDDAMPPDGERLAAEQRATLRLWINDGADFGGWTGEEAPKKTVESKPAGSKDIPKERSRFAVYRSLGEGVTAAPEQAVKNVRAAGARAEPVLPDSPLLRVEWMSDPSRADDKILKLLAPLKNHIAVLGLGETKVTDKAMAEIGKMPRLVALDLHKTEITDKGLESFVRQRPKELRRLNLYGTDVTDKAVTLLTGLKRLRALYLWDTKVTGAGATMLRADLPSCRVSVTRDLPPEEQRRDDGDGRRRRR